MMWKIISARATRYLLPPLSVIRTFAENGLKSDWTLNNDIIRNAISSKSQKLRRNDDTNDSKHREGFTNGGRGKNRFQAASGDRQLLHSRRKNIVIKWDTGNERDKEAANFIMSKVMRMNKSGTIHVINPESNKIEETSIRKFAKGVNLSESGFSIADFKQINEHAQIPLVKLVDRKTALKRYSDEIAKRKQAELVSMGLMKKAQVNTNDTERAEDLVKQIKISWQIKLDDLTKQKAHEIVSQLKRGFKVYLYLDDRNSINSRNWASSFEQLRSNKLETKGISDKELLQRESVLKKLDQITEDYSVQPVKDGNIGTRMMIKLAPKPALYNNKDKAKQALKEHRKRERQEKLERRIEKKKNKNSTSV